MTFGLLRVEEPCANSIKSTSGSIVVKVIIIITSRNAKHCGASLSDERVTI